MQVIIQVSIQVIMEVIIQISMHVIMQVSMQDSMHKFCAGFSSLKMYCPVWLDLSEIYLYLKFRFAGRFLGFLQNFAWTAWFLSTFLIISREIIKICWKILPTFPGKIPP